MIRRARLSIAPCAWALGLTCLVPISASAAESGIRLVDATSASAIRFQHSDGSEGKRYIVEFVASGLATFDYDGDGLIDVYFLTGGPLEGKRVDRPPTNALYRNQGNLRFADTTEKAGVGIPGFGLGVAVADYDNDGPPDVYVSNFGPNVLYRNRGDGAFADVTAKAGVGRGNKLGAGTAFLDMDGDGDLDLYASNYVKFSYQNHPVRTALGHRIYPSPLDFAPEPDDVFRNNGDGTFTDVSRASGVAAAAGTGMGMVCADYDRDGRTDVFVANDVMPNYLWRNDGRGFFEETALLAGVAYAAAGRVHGNMGVNCGDYDNDGRLDFFVTAYRGEFATLYRNVGEGTFLDVTRTSRAGRGSYNTVKWGCGLVDFDNDGHRDLFVACGHLYDNVESFDDTTTYRTHNVLLQNRGNGTFADVSESSGLRLVPKQSSRGAAFDDLDNDGRIDVVVLNSRSGPTILHNESSLGNHWLQIRLRGVKTNRDGVGAAVQVTSGTLVQADEVHSGRGYQSHYGSRLHFGLGRRDRVDRIEVRWIGGGTDVLENVAADRVITITEGGRGEE